MKRESDAAVAIGTMVLGAMLLALAVGFIVYPPAGWVVLGVLLATVAFAGDTRG